MYELLAQFNESNRNYRGYDLHLNIISKVFNHGCGAIDLFRFYPAEKKIVINKSVYNKSDKRKLDEFCRDAHLENWERVFTTLGYPDWYFHRLSLPS